MTQFEQAQQQVREGKLQTPSVSNGGKQIDYFGYQLAVHRFNLKIMASGMTCRGVKFSDLKRYYGLKGRSASDCLPQFEKILADYKAELDKPSIEEILS
jgi:hypothetical protein